MKKYIFHVLLFWVGLGVILAQNTTEQVVIDQFMVPAALVTDADLIKKFLDIYMILEEDHVDKIQIIDATGNGFGENDLLKCFPSGMTYFMYPNKEAEAIMKGWKFTSNYENVTGIIEPELLKTFTVDPEKNWILASLLEGLNVHYTDDNVKIYFEKDTSTITFEMWGYNPDSLYWHEPPPVKTYPDTIFDIVQIIRSDTMYVADTTFYDQFYVLHTIADTVYISQKDPKRMKIPVNPSVLPGIIK